MIKIYSLTQMKDEMIGQEGTPSRDEYEFKLKCDLMDENTRIKQCDFNLTQVQLGEVIVTPKS